MISLHGKTVLLSKTNQIGDVIMTLPAATEIKKHYPDARILFLASASKTKDIVNRYQDVDQLINWDEIQEMPEEKAIEYIRSLGIDSVIHFHPNKAIARLMKKAKIPIRVGTSRRMYHFLYCNRWRNVSRSQSNLHETELDMMLLKPFTNKAYYTKDEIIALREFKSVNANEKVSSLIDKDKFNLIIHPKTRGEHIEWSPSFYAELICQLPQDKFKVFITGSQKEGEKVYQELIEPVAELVTDLTGKTSLGEVIDLIALSDGLIAGSTGPVHIAAAYGIHTLGMYAPIKPFHAGRWGPVGKQAESLSIEKDCSDCRINMRCHCVNEIPVDQVKTIVLGWQKNKENS
ncbi:MAG: glycosyltransferase family 9 protein [Gammaproteobacteria bacterium]|nr:MAG: glycosyltransferase family 9 protein [Gammaproteobacteria bacterium]UTW42659.1 glycosyltransferase family 9 protein [bacterium SCSIO 12844]